MRGGNEISPIGPVKKSHIISQETICLLQLVQPAALSRPSKYVRLFIYVTFRMDGNYYLSFCCLEINLMSQNYRSLRINLTLLPFAKIYPPFAVQTSTTLYNIWSCSLILPIIIYSKYVAR